MSETKLYQSETKKPWQSKTLWVNLLLAALAFFPQVSVSPEIVGVVFTVANFILRLVTKKPISIE